VPVPGGSGTVIHKEPLGVDSDQRRRHETTILRRLAGVAGVAQLAAAAAGPEVIVLEDLGGKPLRAALPMTGPGLVRVALELATILAAVHRRGVVHKDISPANIVLTDDGALALIDFELATTFAEERPSFVHPSQIAGTLAYIAPEQTGRTGGAVDQRADLYSLGATLFELAVGRPPFRDEDPLQLIHRHLAERPEAPADLDPSVPRVLSDIILRLLEKEPEQRYQSAEGLAYDLALLRDGKADDPALVVLGERDFPLRLAPPSRLVGRNAEIADLKAAFSGAVRGDGRVLLVCGPPGVGKTALIDELRPVVAARGGWFVTGRFDQNPSDVTSDAAGEALRGVIRLLLAEPDASLAKLRTCIAEAMGGNARIVASLLPELAVLLDLPAAEPGAEAGDSEARLFQGILQLLRAVVSPDRPLVMVVDDLQWGSATPVGFLDAVLRDADIAGLLIVGAYREAEVDDARPWPTMLARWERLGCVPARLRVANLPAADLGALLAEMLRLPAAAAARLAAAIATQTGGNPYDSVELVNALRRDGILLVGDAGWTWDPEALLAFVAGSDVDDLLAARLQRLPAASQALLELMACLAADVEPELLRAATGEPAEKILELLAPALEDGLLVLERADSVRFRHDRVQQAAYARLDSDRRGELRLAAARRLADDPGFGMVAAQQYLAALDRVLEPAERRRVVGLFRLAAGRIQLVNAATAEQFLAAAVRLIAESGAPEDDRLLAEVQPEWHAALYALGRLAEADEVYREIERRDPDPLTLTPSVCVQISSLTGRGFTAEAVALALGLLRRLGLRVPGPAELAAEAVRTREVLDEWAAAAYSDADRNRPEISDPRVAAAARVINRAMPPSFFSDQLTMAWLVAEACRLWTEHGPHAALVCPIGHAMIVTAAHDDYRTGYVAVRRVLAASAARGYEPETSQARFLFAVSAGHWFEPLEEDIQEARQAYEGLLNAGDLLFACFTFHASTPSMLDCATNLDSFAAEVEAGISFAARTGNEQTSSVSLSFRQLVRSLRDESAEPAACFADPDYLSAVDRHPMAAAYYHIARAQAAAIFADAEGLLRHSAAAMPLLPYIQGAYATARAYLMRALALAHVAREGQPAERAGALAELDECRQWLARRAADGPATFGHLVRLIEAERAWAVGADRDAAVAFDAALEEVAPRRRPWHHALITERAAAFHQANGTQRTGRMLLTEAAQLYRAWGATAKVRRLEAAQPFLRGRVESPARSGDSTITTRVSMESIDLLAVLKASQVLSSETNLDRLRIRVVEVMRTLTGAGIVQLLVRGEADGWFLYDDDSGTSLPLAEAVERGLLPLSAVRYAERTRIPLLVEDATHDDRFARDRYVAALDRCSLLVVPILVQGSPRAMVLLENRLGRNMFTPDRLDAVALIAGQLAVSLDNALLYASLERKVTERTQELAEANRQLQELSTTDALTGLANRRRLGDLLDEEWQRGLDSGATMSVAMIDVDHFKLYNDHYGHLAGDDCLRRVAAAVNETVRAGDTVARYGGEEFAIVLRGHDVEAAYRVAERVRAAVEALDEPHAMAAAGRVTVSIGVATSVPEPGRTPEQLVADADAHLYHAKHAGRNRVAWAGLT